MIEVGSRWARKSASASAAGGKEARGPCWCLLILVHPSDILRTLRQSLLTPRHCISSPVDRAATQLGESSGRVDPKPQPPSRLPDNPVHPSASARHPKARLAAVAHSMSASVLAASGISQAASLRRQQAGAAALRAPRLAAGSSGSGGSRSRRRLLVQAFRWDPRDPKSSEKIQDWVSNALSLVPSRSPAPRCSPPSPPPQLLVADTPAAAPPAAAAPLCCRSACSRWWSWPTPTSWTSWLTRRLSWQSSCWTRTWCTLMW